MGIAGVAACGDDKTNADPGARPDAGSPADAAIEKPIPDASPISDAAVDSGTWNVAILNNPDFTLADMQAVCDQRQGFVYVNAACAGGAMCKGLSFHTDTLWDHSCRGQNQTCSGIGCVDMPADTGKTGKQIYEDGPCGGCHADWEKTPADYSKYAVFYYKPDVSEESALAEFDALTDKQLEAKVAWGASGFHKDGTPYQNMDAYYRKYSLAEVKRVAAHLRTLTPFPYEYKIFGVDGGVDAGH